MKEIRIELTEPEAEYLKEVSERAGISVEEAAKRAIRYVLKEVTPINPQFYDRHEVLRRNGGGQRWRD